MIVFRDVTEKLHMDEERQKADKLESLGVVAGGIAHDFNNILTAILGNLSLAMLAENIDPNTNGTPEGGEEGDASGAGTRPAAPHLCEGRRADQADGLARIAPARYARLRPARHEGLERISPSRRAVARGDRPGPDQPGHQQSCHQCRTRPCPREARCESRERISICRRAA